MKEWIVWIDDKEMARWQEYDSRDEDFYRTVNVILKTTNQLSALDAVNDWNIGGFENQPERKR